VHVKGHQDKDPKRQLTIPEQHNVECDRLAKQFVQTSPTTSTDIPTPEFKVAQPHLIIQGQVICRRFIPALRMATSAPAYWQYLKKTKLDTSGYTEYPLAHPYLCTELSPTK